MYIYTYIYVYSEDHQTHPHCPFSARSYGLPTVPPAIYPCFNNDAFPCILKPETSVWGNHRLETGMTSWLEVAGGRVLRCSRALCSGSDTQGVDVIAGAIPQVPSRITCPTVSHIQAITTYAGYRVSVAPLSCASSIKHPTRYVILLWHQTLTRWSTNHSSKVKLHHITDLRDLCGAKLVTQHPGIHKETVLYLVEPRTTTSASSRTKTAEHSIECGVGDVGEGREGGP